MRRFVTLFVLLLFSVPFGVSVSGCAHNAAPEFCNGGDSGMTTTQAATITLQPLVYGISLNYAEIGQLQTPSTTDCKGSNVSELAYSYATTDMTIADVQPTTGKLCAGTWNRNSGGGIPDFTYCIPTNKSGTAYMTASADGVTSNPLPVFIHPVITSIVLGGPSSNCTTDPTTACCPLATSGAVTAPPYLANSCISQGNTAQLVSRVFAGPEFTGLTVTGSNIVTSVSTITGLVVGQTVTSSAFPSGTTIKAIGAAAPYALTLSANATATNSSPIAFNNISCLAGHLQYTVQGASSSVAVSPVVSIDQNGVATANQPGSVLISANLADAASSAGLFSTCPPASIALSPAGVTGNPVVVNENNPQPLLATVLDTNGVPITGLSLEYVSTAPTTIPAASTVTPPLAGAGAITAICQPPLCNSASYNQIGLFGNGLPVTSNSVNITTPGTNSTVLYMASTQSLDVVQIDFTTSVLGQPYQLPFVPNSMLISNDGSTIYMGSATALMVLNAVNALSLSRADTSSPGTVLALSPNGSLLVISDPVHQVTTLESSSGSVISSYGGVATHAEFSPDSQTVYIAAGNQLLVYSLFTGWTNITPATPVSDVAITVPSVGAYFAGPTTTARGYCPASTPTTVNGVTTETNIFYPPADFDSATTDRIAATNDGLHILGVTAATSKPTLSDLRVTIPVGACTPATTPLTNTTVTSGLSFSHTLSTAPLSPLTATAITGVLPASDSTIALITYTGSGGVLPAYAPSASGPGTTTYIKLSGTATAPIAGVISADNATIYAATSGDNLVHLISRSTLTDTSTLAPNLLAAPNQSVPAGTVVPVNLLAQKPRSTT
jgi:hypothetical protein